MKRYACTDKIWVQLTLTLVSFFLAHSSAYCDLIENKLNSMRTMSASFVQVVKTKKRTVSTSSGTMALSRPGRFRWETKSPMEQLVVADGKHVWIYDVDLEQVSVKKQEKSLGGTAALFISGYDDTVKRDFDVQQYNNQGISVFDLHARSSKQNFQRVVLMYAGEMLKGIELFDQLGQRTEVKFSDIKINSPLPTDLFVFKVPKGVDLVEQ